MRIFGERFLEKLQCPAQPFFRALIQMITALRVEVMRRQISRRTPRASRAPRPFDLTPQPLCHAACNLFLHRKHVVTAPIERFRPQVAAINGIHKARHDPQIAARPAHAARQNQSGIIPRGCLARIQLAVALMPRPCHQPDRLDARQRVNDFLAQPIAKIFLIPRRAVIGERCQQNRIPADQR